MATTFSTAKTALDEIAQRIQQNRMQLKQAQGYASSAEGSLAGMPAQYGQIIADIDAAAASAPGNAAFQNVKAEKDQLVAEFTALQATAQQMKAALQAFAL